MAKRKPHMKSQAVESRQRPAAVNRRGTRENRSWDRCLSLAMLMPVVLSQGSALLAHPPENRAQRQLSQVRDVLADLETTIRGAATAGSGRDPGVAAAAIDVDQALESLDSMVARLAAKEPDSGSASVTGSAMVSCIVPGEAGILYMFLSAAHLPYEVGSITVLIVGSEGTQQFTFASGVSTASVVTAINTFTRETGVRASPVSASPYSYRVKLQSTQEGQDQFVAGLITTKPLAMFSDSLTAPGEPSEIDFGTSTFVPWSATP